MSAVEVARAHREPPSRRTRIAFSTFAALLLLALGWSVLRLAWLSDDAYITFRTVENVVHGHGACWNVGERVQTYTHPLWFLLLVLLRAATGELPLPSIVLGMVLSAVTVALLLRLAGAATAAVATLALLLGSRAWPAFATSGLESSLVFVLATLLVVIVLRAAPERRLRGIALVTGLLLCTRTDLLLLALPPLVVAARTVPWRRAVATLALGLVPAFAWYGFALVYYGSPFPITAYAKAFAHGVPAGELAQQGLRYVGRTVTDDPVSAAAIALGIGLGFARRGTRALAFAALCYVGYAVKVGGDYMLGRFLLPAQTVAIALVAQSPFVRRPLGAVAVAVAALALWFVPGVPPALRPPSAPRLAERIADDGIMDEQDWLYRENGLLSPHRIDWQPGGIAAMLRATGYQGRAVVVAGVIGVIGYGVGEHVHVVDPWLCDPLLMRLPVADRDHWRIGHFFRRFPAGFLESLATGDNRIRHPGLARYHDVIRSVVRDPVFAAERWRNLFALWTGRANADLAAFVAERYYDPPREVVPLAAFAAPLPPSGFWFDTPAARSAQCGGLAVRLPAPSDAAALVVSATGDTRYTLTFRRSGVTLATTTFGYVGEPLLGMQPQRIDVPAAARPFDELWIDATPSPEFPAAACIGRIELVP